jgi:hypothetical protein
MKKEVQDLTFEFLEENVGNFLNENNTLIKGFKNYHMNDFTLNNFLLNELVLFLQSKYQYDDDSMTIFVNLFEDDIFKIFYQKFN